eukprot:5005367-Pyramimonas_sp.AAC.1
MKDEPSEPLLASLLGPPLGPAHSKLGTNFQDYLRISSTPPASAQCTVLPPLSATTNYLVTTLGAQCKQALESLVADLQATL